MFEKIRKNIKAYIEKRTYSLLVENMRKGPKNFEELLKSKPKINLNVCNDDEYKTPIILFSVEYYENCLELLIKCGANIHATTKNGFTILMTAVLKHEEDTVDFIIKSGVDINAQDDHGWTALMYAAQHYIQHIPVLVKAGADVKIKNSRGETALMRTVGKTAYPQRKVTEDIIKCLLNAGADFNEVNKFGQTFWDFAKENNIDIYQKYIYAKEQKDLQEMPQNNNTNKIKIL